MKVEMEPSGRMFIRTFHLITLQNCRFASSTGNPLTGKGKKPWDKRFPVHPKDISERKKGGNRKIQHLLTEHIVAPTGVKHSLTKKFIHVKEMVPEFVVPDLEGFELKPYVSYLSKEITQNKITPEQIFNSAYASRIEDDYHAGKIQIEDGKVKLKDGTVFDLETGHQEPAT